MLKRFVKDAESLVKIWVFNFWIYFLFSALTACCPKEDLRSIKDIDLSKPFHCWFLASAIHFILMFVVFEFYKCYKLYKPIKEIVPNDQITVILMQKQRAHMLLIMISIVCMLFVFLRCLDTALSNVIGGAFTLSYISRFCFHKNIEKIKLLNGCFF